MKTISVIIPCYNEEKSVSELHCKLTKVFNDYLSKYQYEIIFCDDYSKDNTRDKIRDICENDPEHAKAIFNSSNFGFARNIFDSFKYTKGDAVFLIFGDMQDPPELLPEFVKKWEEGKTVIIGKKIDSDENIGIKIMRKMYYGLMNMLAETSQISDFNGYGLYDRSFVEILNSIDDMQPYLKQVVAEYSPDYAIIG